MSQNAFFHNFTSEPFTGYWNGKGKTFKAGEKKLMPTWMAEHFAKHLTNQELLKLGKENYTSPKFPQQVPEFMTIFNKACIYEEEDENENDIDNAIDLAQGTHEPSMNIRVTQPKPHDPYNATETPVTGPAGPSTVVTGPDDAEVSDESTFEGNEEKPE